MKSPKVAVQPSNIAKTSDIAKITGANFSAQHAPRCGQCNKEIRHLPFAIANIICRECYGLDRYRRQSLTPPGASAEPVVAVAPRTALVDNPTPKTSSRRAASEKTPKA